MSMPRRDLNGLAATLAMSDVLLRLRAEDPMAGLYEAGDIQWWWKDATRLTSNTTTLWTDDAGVDCAFLTVAESSSGGKDVNIVWLPSVDRTFRAQVLPGVIDHLASLPVSEDAPVDIAIDGQDADLQILVTAAGFRHEPASDLVQMWQRPATPPAGPALPDGFRFSDDRTRPADKPHHLARRNGPDIADRLAECPLYRRDLDLSIQTGGGTVAAYCLCWLDTRNGVGLFEPVRTEDEWQRRGLGRALMAEGIRRLMAGGATLIKVAHEANNPASKGLYLGAGFHDDFYERHYIRSA